MGYGKMGQMIEKIALARGHTIAARLTSRNQEWEALQQTDICIDFTHPECVIDNIKKIAELKKNVVIGTTGWHDSMDIVRSIVDENNIGALHSPNFSIGVHLFFQIVAHASKLINAFQEYDVAGIEYHHNSKKDAPSGTALEMAKVIETNMKRIDKVPLSSVRCGSIPGIHTVLFDSFCDTLSITHEARSREGFALGAVLAAEWLKGKRGLYTFADCVQDIIQARSS